MLVISTFFAILFSFSPLSLGIFLPILAVLFLLM